MKRYFGQKRETLVLIAVTLAVAAELTWVVQHVRAEVLVPQAAANGNPTVFTATVIQAAKP
jgi:hypothetical protein